MAAGMESASTRSMASSSRYPPALAQSSGGHVRIQNARADLEDEERRPAAGQVGNASQPVSAVVKKWLVYEDGVVASRMQETEINNHYEQNRWNRRTVREDIPVAKEAFSEEQARAQYERMRQLEENRRVAERDADMARQLQDRLAVDRGRAPPQYPAHDAMTLQSGGVTQDQQQFQPVAMYARNQSRLSEIQSSPSNDYHVLDPMSQSQPRDQLLLTNQPQASSRGPSDNEWDEDPDEEQMEAEDHELAMRLQKEEQERYERKKQQRALARERKRLERLIEQSNQMSAEGGEGIPRQAGPRGPPGQSQTGEDYSDLYIPPDPNMSEEEGRRLQEEQDAEIARLVQDAESRGARGGRDAALRQRLRQIESQDEQLARIIQEEENLRAKRRALKQQQKVLQQQREVAERIATGGEDANAQTNERVHGRSQRQNYQSDESPHETTYQYQARPPHLRETEQAALPGMFHTQVASADDRTTTNNVSNTSRNRSPQPVSRLTALPSGQSSDIYAEQPIARIPGRNPRHAVEEQQDLSPTDPPPEVPERRYREFDNQSEAQAINPGSAHLQPEAMALQIAHRDQTQQVENDYERLSPQGRGPTSGGQNRHPAPQPQENRPLARLKDMPPYRAQRPPPYKNSASESRSQHKHHTSSQASQPQRQTTTAQGHNQGNSPGHSPSRSQGHTQGHPPGHAQGHIHEQSANRSRSDFRWVDTDDRRPHAADERVDDRPDSHYDTPWMNIEDRILSSQGEQIVPRQVSPPAGRNTQPQHPHPTPENERHRRHHDDHPHRHSHRQHGQSADPRSHSTHHHEARHDHRHDPRHAGADPRHAGSDPRYAARAHGTNPRPAIDPSTGKPYIVATESGHLVMNIAEMIDPTYDGRGQPQGRRPTQHAGAVDADSEFTAISGQRRSQGKSGHSSRGGGGKRESCKQQ